MIYLGIQDYKEPCQWWFALLQGICFFIYRFCDEMDGKHARATGNGSPLGLLFDHGCDCFALGMEMMIFNYLAGIQVTASWNTCAFLMIVSYMAFHFETLEAYYRGKLVLAACNGATDGSTIYILWTFVIAIIGPDKLLIPFTVLGFEMTVSFLCMMAVISSTSIYTVIK